MDDKNEQQNARTVDGLFWVKVGDFGGGAFL